MPWKLPASASLIERTGRRCGSSRRCRPSLLLLHELRDRDVVGLGFTVRYSKLGGSPCFSSYSAMSAFAFFTFGCARDARGGNPSVPGRNGPVADRVEPLLRISLTSRACPGERDRLAGDGVVERWLPAFSIKYAVFGPLVGLVDVAFPAFASSRSATMLSMLDVS